MAEYAWATYNQNIKTAYNDAGQANGAFSSFQVKGKYEWKDDYSELSFWWVDANGDAIDPQPSKYLLLKDNDVPFSRASATKMVVASGWRVTVQLATDNNWYWEDNTQPDASTYYANTQATNRQDFITVVLNGSDNDYISIDLDEEYSGIANFRIKSGGEMVNIDKPKNINDEVRIRLVKVEHWEPIQDEVQGPLEEGGEGDLDNDGVKDKDDADPYDPDIQEEGDVDDDPDDPFEEQPPQDDDDNGGDGGGDGGDEEEESSFFKVFVMGGVLLLIGSIVWVYLRGMGGEVIGE